MGLLRAKALNPPEAPLSWLAQRPDPLRRALFGRGGIPRPRKRQLWHGAAFGGEGAGFAEAGLFDGGFEAGEHGAVLGGLGNPFGHASGVGVFLEAREDAALVADPEGEQGGQRHHAGEFWEDGSEHGDGREEAEQGVACGAEGDEPANGVSKTFGVEFWRSWHWPDPFF
jgi:hypothetical protein